MPLYLFYTNSNSFANKYKHKKRDNPRCVGFYPSINPSRVISDSPLIDTPILLLLTKGLLRFPTSQFYYTTNKKSHHIGRIIRSQHTHDQVSILYHEKKPRQHRDGAGKIFRRTFCPFLIIVMFLLAFLICIIL